MFVTLIHLNGGIQKMNFFGLTTAESIVVALCVLLVGRLLYYFSQIQTDPKVRADFLRNWGVVKDDIAPHD